MKIVYIATGLSTGGAEIMLYHLLSRIDRERFNPFVISLIDRGSIGERIEKLGISVFSIGMNTSFPKLIDVWHLFRTIHRIKPDLIQGWMYHGNLAAQVAGLLFWKQIPLFWSIHHAANCLHSEKKMTAAIIQFGAKISYWTKQNIFVSKISKIQHDLLGYCQQNSCVIPNGFDTELFQPSTEYRRQLRDELALDQNCILFGLIGRYHPLKDHSNFIQAAAIAAQKSPDIRFILAGKNIDKENHSLMQMIQEAGLLERIYLLGERSDVNCIAAALDIFSLTSISEAFPLTIGEAMSCGVPCVVTDVGDAAWIVSDTGRVVPSKAPQSLADAWQELIDMGSEGRKVLGEAARARILANFSLESVVAQYENLYAQALAKTK